MSNNMEQRPTHIFRQETKHSMLRRCNNWDYKKRGIYMLTLVTAKRIVDGQLLIEQNGVIYNVLGARLK